MIIDFNEKRFYTYESFKEFMKRFGKDTTTAETERKFSETYDDLQKHRTISDMRFCLANMKILHFRNVNMIRIESSNWLYLFRSSCDSMKVRYFLPSDKLSDYVLMRITDFISLIKKIYG